MSTHREEHHYFSRVVFLTERPIGLAPGVRDEDELPVSFYFLKQRRHWYDSQNDFSYINSVAANLSSFITFSRRHQPQVCTELMAGHLSEMGVAREEHQTILEKLLHEAQAAVPGGHIVVLIADVIVWFPTIRGDISSFITRGNPNIYISNKMLSERVEIRDVDYHTSTDRVALESFETYKIKFIPAARSAIEGLQKMRVDSLEEAQNQSCRICMDEFAQGGVDRLITPLPCTHLFHADCITQWLETSHLCPLCRYALPSEEDGQPSTS